jgi:rfaE bifunctional protein kinase chain/domain
VAEGTLRFPQPLARIDRLDRRPASKQMEAALIAQVQQLVPTVDAVLVSDYQTGVTNESVVQAALTSAHALDKLCAVDAQGAFHKYVGFDIVKGNRKEIEGASGIQLDGEEDYRLAGERLLRELKAGAVIITRGAEGVSLLGRDEEYRHVPAVNRSEVFDVTGAGDTVIAVMTLASLSGASLAAAAQLANYAAGLVVRKLGNAVATAEELAWAVENW